MNDDADEFAPVGRPIGELANIVTGGIADQFAAWGALLRGERPMLHSDDPASGYYRIRYKRGVEYGPWEPVAIWRDNDGKLWVLRAGREVAIDQVWPWCAKFPIRHEVYEAVAERGEPWPDASPAVMGHNASPPGDGIDEIRDRIDDLARDAERMIAAGGAQTKDAADHASDLANVLAELSAKADKAREAEKAPHLEAGRQVDAAWRPLITRATELKARLKAIVVTPFLARLEQERQAAAAAAIAAGKPADEAAPPKTTAGSMKRSTALRTHKRADIEDWVALLTALKDHPDIQAAAQKVADAAARTGVAMAGCKIVTERRAA